MKSTTAARLQELEQVDWFHAVGKGHIPELKVAASWMEAVVKCASEKWETVQYDAMYLHKLAVYDAISGLSVEQRRERDLDAIREEVAAGPFVDSGPYLQFDFPQWDRIRAELKPVVVDLVTRKTEGAVAKFGLPDVVATRAVWDILCMGMEYEFAEVVPGGFFAAIADIYLLGHFPCGWEGNWPEGHLIVY